MEPSGTTLSPPTLAPLGKAPAKFDVKEVGGDLQRVTWPKLTAFQDDNKIQNFGTQMNSTSGVLFHIASENSFVASFDREPRFKLHVSSFKLGRLAVELLKCAIVSGPLRLSIVSF